MAKRESTQANLFGEEGYKTQTQPVPTSRRIDRDKYDRIAREKILKKEILFSNNGRVITCFICNYTSNNFLDIKYTYCRNCDTFLKEVATDIFKANVSK